MDNLIGRISNHAQCSTARLPKNGFRWCHDFIPNEITLNLEYLYLVIRIGLPYVTLNLVCVLEINQCYG